MSAAIEIRPGRPDHPQVGALLASLDAYLAALYEPEANHILGVDALLAPDVRFLTAWDGEAAVGCGAVRRLPGEPASGGLAYGEIKRMVVAPSHRGRGIARTLLSRLEELAAADGLALVLLETGSAQTEAVQLYRRAGYAERGPFNGYPDNGLSLFMGKPLRP